MIVNITSSRNEKYKYFKSLKQKKFRTAEYTVEGKKSVLEALNSKAGVTSIIMSETFLKNGGNDFSDNVCYVVSDGLFSALSSTETPSGIMCTIKINKRTDFCPNPEKLYIYCDRVSDPGNLGTIIRTADAAGFGGVLFSPGCAELYNPKTVRSSMGSFFRMSMAENITYDNLCEYKKRGFRILSGVLNENSVSYTEADMTLPSVIVIGNESNGVSKELASLSDVCIKIPMAGGAESLNAGVAAAIIMYEAVRQRSAIKK